MTGWAEDLNPSDWRSSGRRCCSAWWGREGVALGAVAKKWERKLRRTSERLCAGVVEFGVGNSKTGRKRLEKWQRESRSLYVPALPRDRVGWRRLAVTWRAWRSMFLVVTLEFTLFLGDILISIIGCLNVWIDLKYWESSLTITKTLFKRYASLLCRLCVGFWSRERIRFGHNL